MKQANSLAAKVAIAACDAALKTSDASSATNWLTDATNYGAPVDVVGRLRKALLALVPPPTLHGPITNLFRIANLDFVWVKEIGTNKTGAYIAVNELSWGQCNTLLKRLGRPAKIIPNEDREDQPASFDPREEATDFIVALNTSSTALSPTSLDLPNGKWRLLSEASYQRLAGISETNGWSKDPKFGWLPNPATIEELNRLGENMAGGNDKGRIKTITEQKPRGNPGLRFLVGNVREWTEDGKQFGISYNAPPTAKSHLGMDRPASEGVHVGLRLVASEDK